ncbi:methyl-accepting chemotaxis protein [Paenibacillus qinlingensis]|uniref:methyl-accepting chemotaxis protein n=1 Tax=Paenibacillus qinlingensis TaxID=1837343 RepID=UPI001564D609|nr:methyl-accepting chemotaxis protein [Paenibacillus qinlingensis]NQX60008.1 methyl-accepting chemotaxis protein [Paenibacillus qinlingensis]
MELRSIKAKTQFLILSLLLVIVVAITSIVSEPNLYSNKTKYVSTNAYLNENQITITHDYSDPKYGTYKDNKATALSNLVNTIMSEEKGTSTYTASQGLIIVYYSKLEQNDWVLAVAVPRQELNTKINVLRLKTIVVLLIGMILIVWVILLYTRNRTAHTTRVNRMAGHLVQSDFIYSIKVKSKNEFGTTAENSNHSRHVLSKMLVKVSEHSSHVVFNSEKMTANTEQTSTVAEKG